MCKSAKRRFLILNFGITFLLCKYVSALWPFSTYIRNLIKASSLHPCAYICFAAVRLNSQNSTTYSNIIPFLIITSINQTLYTHTHSYTLIRRQTCSYWLVIYLCMLLHVCSGMFIRRINSPPPTSALTQPTALSTTTHPYIGRCRLTTMRCACASSQSHVAVHACM